MKSKNILVLTGSPRKGGNSELLADAFIKGAIKKGHTVNKFETAFKNIQGCKACDACWSNGKACVFEDDFMELVPFLNVAEVMVLCTPVYWFGMTAQIKLAIDKLYSYVKPSCPNKLKIKESCLITCAGDPGEEIFEGVVGTYKGIVNYLKWKDRGILTAPSVHGAGEVLKTDFVSKAEELGKSI
jgi:multimeric flavodoxin WrbA